MVRSVGVMWTEHRIHSADRENRVQNYNRATYKLYS